RRDPAQAQQSGALLTQPLAGPARWGRRLARDRLSWSILFRRPIHRRHRRLFTKTLGGVPHGVRYRSVDSAGSTPHLLSPHNRCDNTSAGSLRGVGASLVDRIYYAKVIRDVALV